MTMLGSYTTGARGQNSLKRISFTPGSTVGRNPSRVAKLRKSGSIRERTSSILTFLSPSP